MLTRLRIRNLALVSDLELELASGFNVITGETGAGKSILIGALNLLVGGRADRDLLRAGSEGCTVEGTIDICHARASLGAFLEERGIEPCDDGQLLIKRTFTPSGNARQFVNGSPAPLQTLATLGDWLVDIHGPHDHQSLFQTARQLELLDGHAGLEAGRSRFAALFDRRGAIEAEIAGWVTDERTYHQQLDLLRHQVQEISAARLEPDEMERLEAEHHRARNAARILECARDALDVLAESEGALLVRVVQLGKTLHEWGRLDPSATDLQVLQEQAVENLRQLQAQVARSIDRLDLDLDPARLRELEQRLDLVHSLRRKYGSTLREILEFGADAQSRLTELEAREVRLGELNAELARVQSELNECGATLGAARRQAIPALAGAVGRQLLDLGFKQCEFDIALRPAPGPARSGLDAAEFLFSPNPGEPARPLRTIASSGELARVMLALKTVLAAQDDVPIVVFDEVDANVGGETAHALGDKMREIGQRRQVLCITHLAPVAAAAAAHYVVTKDTEDGRTHTRIEPVTGPARIAELGRMLGGGEAARRHAEVLLSSRKPGREGRRGRA